MVRDLVSALDYAFCAESALTLFVATFLWIFYGTLRLSRSSSERFANIPLSDNIEDPRNDG